MAGQAPPNLHAKAWFQNEVLLQRAIHATVIGCITQCVLLFTFIILMKLDILHPFISIYTSVVDGLHPVYWPHWFCLWISGAALSCLFYFELRVWPDYVSSKIDCLISVLAPRRILALGAYIVLSIITVKSYLGIIERHSEEQMSASDDEVFIVGCGVFTGLGIYLYMYYWNGRCMTFPIIMTGKFQELKHRAKKMCGLALVTPRKPVACFIAVYFVYGKHLFSGLISPVQLGNTGYPRYTLWGLLDLKFLLYVYSCCCVFTLAILFLKEVMELHLIEPYDFPVSESVEISMDKVLQVRDDPLLIQLACLDFRNMVCYSVDNRLPDYKKSLWLSLLSQCIQIIQNFTSELKLIHAQNSSGTSISPIQQACASSGMAFRVRDYGAFTLRHRYATPAEVLQPPRHFYRRESPDTPQNVLYGVRAQEVEDVTVLSDIVLIYGIVCKYLKTFGSMIMDSLQRFRLFKFLFQEDEDVKLRKLYGKSQHISWLVQGLSCVVTESCASEDVGVICDDITEVLSTLITLHQLLDRSPLRNGRRNVDSADTLDIQNRIMMSVEVKSANHRLLKKFKTLVFNMNLTDDQLRYVDYFFSYTSE